MAVGSGLLLAALIGRASAPARVVEAGRPELGPTRVEAGVPVGYAHRPAGAALAVANYEQAFANPAVLRPRGLRDRIEAVATPDFAATMLRTNSPGVQRIASGAIGEGLAHRVQTLYTAVPIGYRIESYSPARARILTWAFTLLGNESAVEPEAYFGVTRTDLVWSEGDWKIAGSRGGFGPTPKIETAPGPVDGFDVIALARRLRSYALAP